MRFSIVVPTYNRAQLVKQTVLHLLALDYDDYEVIVVDDGSTDNTQQLIAEIHDPKLKYFKKNNEERAAARNFGLHKSSGDYVNFFDSDDTAYLHHLEVAEKMISTHQNPEVFHLNYDYQDAITGIISSNNISFKNINKSLISGNILSCNGVFIRKDVAIANQFNQDRDLSASEDYLLWLKLAAQYPIHASNKVTSTIVNHDGRSVLNFNFDKLKKRKELMILYLFEDPITKKHYEKHKKRLVSDAQSYIALHAALDKNSSKSDALSYFWKAVKSYPTSIFQRRSLAIIKHLILR